MNNLVYLPPNKTGEMVTSALGTLLKDLKKYVFMKICVFNALKIIEFEFLKNIFIL